MSACAALLWHKACLPACLPACHSLELCVHIVQLLHSARLVQQLYAGADSVLLLRAQVLGGKSAQQQQASVHAGARKGTGWGKQGQMRAAQQQQEDCQSRERACGGDSRMCVQAA